MQTKTRYKCSCIFALVFLACLFFSKTSHASDLVPAIEVQPGNNVEVGEEVMFNAEGTTYAPDPTWLRRGLYEWDFGDGYVYQKNMPAPYTDTAPSGMSVVHYFMTPGTYTVRLNVNLWGSWTGDKPTRISTVSTDTMTIGNGNKTLTVGTGLKFTPGVEISVRGDGRDYWSMAAGSLVMMGTVTSYDPVSGSLQFNATFKMGEGTSLNNWTVSGSPIIGDVTETKTVIVNVSGAAPLSGFELQHAPFHNRTKQWIYAEIPAEYRVVTTKLKITLFDDTANSSSVLLNKNNLSAEEPYLLDHTKLTVGHDYILQAELLDSGGNRIIAGNSQGVWRDKFTKPSVAPATTIDENNSFSWKGNLVYPIQSYMLDYGAMVSQFTSDTYINGWHTDGYSNGIHTPANFVNYINSWETNHPGYMATGPGRGDYSWSATAEGMASGLSGSAYKSNHLISRMKDFFAAAKNKASMFMIAIQDEPNMGGDYQKAYSPTLAAWEYAAHAEDPGHPCQVGFVGGDWLNQIAPGAFDYQGNSGMFGGKKWVETTFGYDVLPYAARFSAGLNFTDKGIVAKYFEGKEKMRAWNAATSKSSNYDYTTYKELVPMTATVKPNTTVIYDMFTKSTTDLPNHTHPAVSKTMALGNISFNATPGLGYFVGQPITISNSFYPSSHYVHVMFGTVTSYDGSTGILNINVDRMVGSGTYSDWYVAAEYPVQVPGEVYNIAWMEFIHGAKGMLWFNYFDQESIKFAEMKKFTDIMTTLQSKLLTSVPVRTVTSSATTALNRVDVLIRESGGSIYIVAARLTEPAPLPSVCWVTLTGTPETVINNGKIKDANNIIWSLQPSVTIGADGTVNAMATSETLGAIAAAANTLTNIETPVSGWTSVTNATAATAGSKYTGVEPDSITATFNISNITQSANAQVYDENRNLTVSNSGQFTDTFEKNAVHIYVIDPNEPADTTAPAVPSGLTVD